MEICQHCNMYMKPYVVNDDESKRAICEFCDKTIAIKIAGKWVKHRPIEETNTNF